MSTDPFAAFPPGFPRPDWDQATLTRVVERRAQLQTGCPRHGGTPELGFYKELIVSDSTGEVHLPTMAIYDDGCVANWRIDVEAEAEPVYEKAPKGSY